MGEAKLTLTVTLPDGQEVPEEPSTLSHFIANILFDAAEEFDSLSVREDGSLLDKKGRIGRVSIDKT
jgi:hypothetical protein